MIRAMKKYKNDFFSIIILICIWIIFTFKSFNKQFSFAIWLDNEFYFGPVMSKISGLLALGQWPFWLDNFLGGVKYYDNPQFTPYYPFYFLFTSKFVDRTESMYFMHYLTLGHFLVYLLTSYILLRVLSVNRIISVAVATLIVFNENTYQLASWLTITASFSWLPLALAGTLLVIKNPSRKSFSILFFSILMIVTSCPSQNLMYTILLCTILTLFLILQVPSQNRLARFKQIAINGAVPFVYFLAIVIPIYVPILLGWNGYIRWTGYGAPVIGHNKIAFQDFLSDQLDTSEFLDVIFRTAPLHPSGSVYVGILPVLLALVGLWYCRRDKVYKFFFSLSIYAFLSSFGSNFGLAYINYMLPGINLIRQPSRFLTIFHLSLYVCVGMFLTWLVSQVKQKKSSTSSRSYDGQDLKIAWKRNWISISIASILISVQFATVPINPPRVKTSDYVTQELHKLEDILEIIQEDDPSSKYRTVFFGDINVQRSAMFASYQGIRTVTPYFQPSPYEQFQQVYFYDLYPEEYMNSLSIKYAVCSNCTNLDLPDSFRWKSNFELFVNSGKYSIFVNKRVREPIRISPDTIGRFSNFQSAIDLMSNQASLFTENSIIVEEKSEIRGSNSKLCEIISNSRIGQKITLRYSCEKNSTLVLSELFSPNWIAESESKHLETFKVNGSLLGVALEKGTETIVISYQPQLVTSLWKISGIFLLLFLLLSSLRHIRRAPSHIKPATKLKSNASKNRF
jgi:hypothetical protein